MKSHTSFVSGSLGLGYQRSLINWVRYMTQRDPVQESYCCFIHKLAGVLVSLKFYYWFPTFSFDINASFNVCENLGAIWSRQPRIFVEFTSHSTELLRHKIFLRSKCDNFTKIMKINTAFHTHSPCPVFQVFPYMCPISSCTKNRSDYFHFRSWFRIHKIIDYILKYSCHLAQVALDWLPKAHSNDAWKSTKNLSLHFRPVHMIQNLFQNCKELSYESKAN